MNTTKISPLLLRFIISICGLCILSGCAIYQTVKIKTEPSGANIFVDGVPKGQEPVITSIPVDSFANALGNNHEIVAKLVGYQDERTILHSDSFFFSDTHPYPNVVTLTLQPTAVTAASSDAVKLLNELKRNSTTPAQGQGTSTVLPTTLPPPAQKDAPF